MPALLLKGGIVLQHDVDEHVHAVKTDILVEGNRITQIQNGISAPGATLIDCENKIISPGFVSTHHHVWQTQLRARFGDMTLFEYMPTGNMQSVNFSPKDIFLGELGGCQEAIAAGVTTILDHAHCNITPDHSKMAVSAAASSGVRMVFGYCPTPRAESFDPVKINTNAFESWVMETLEELAKKEHGDGRVVIGFSFDFWHLPEDDILSIFKQVKSWGIANFTSHVSALPLMGGKSALPMIEALGLLDDRWVFSHLNQAAKSDYDLLKKSGAKVSSTPSTELQMVLGQPIAFLDEAREVEKLISWGIDCHTACAGSIISEARLGLQSARGFLNQKFVEKGISPERLNMKVEDAFNIGTINGARALCMENDIGSIAVGKRADLVIFDGLSPAMVCGAQYDPLTAVMLHSSPGDIETVIIDGHIRKLEGKLLPVTVDELARASIGHATMGWDDVAKALLESRKEIQKKYGGVNYEPAIEHVKAMYGIDPSKFVDL